MKKTYEAPQLEILEVAIEQGFAVSDPTFETPGGGGTWPW